MKFTPRSTARRRTRTASSGSRGGPQTPGPVMRIAPKPSRTTGRSPPILNVPLSLAGRSVSFPTEGVYPEWPVGPSVTLVCPDPGQTGRQLREVPRLNDSDQAWNDEVRSEEEHLAHVRECLAAMLSATEQFRPVGADKIAT